MRAVFGSQPGGNSRLDPLRKGRCGFTSASFLCKRRLLTGRKVFLALVIYLLSSSLLHIIKEMLSIGVIGEDMLGSLVLSTKDLLNWDHLHIDIVRMLWNDDKLAILLVIQLLHIQMVVQLRLDLAFVYVNFHV